MISGQPNTNVLPTTNSSGSDLLEEYLVKLIICDQYVEAPKQYTSHFFWLVVWEYLQLTKVEFESKLLLFRLTPLLLQFSLDALAD